MQPQEIVTRSRHDAATGEVLEIEVLEAPPLSLISRALLEDMDPRYRDGDTITLASDVRYRIGAEHGEHGDRLLHRLG